MDTTHLHHPDKPSYRPRPRAARITRAARRNLQNLIASTSTHDDPQPEPHEIDALLEAAFAESAAEPAQRVQPPADHARVADLTYGSRKYHLLLITAAGTPPTLLGVLGSVYAQDTYPLPRHLGAVTPEYPPAGGYYHPEARAQAWLDRTMRHPDKLALHATERAVQRLRGVHTIDDATTIISAAMRVASPNPFHHPNKPGASQYEATWTRPDGREFTISLITTELGTVVTVLVRPRIDHRPLEERYVWQGRKFSYHPPH